MKIIITALLSIVWLAQAQAASKPNMVFIIADDCTFRDIGCYGGQARTPHIDKLATEGMRFTRCFQAAPMCSPTRHNIYTGLYPVKSGAWPNHTRAYPHVKSIVHHLRPLGYRVTQTGKTHINPPEVFPFENKGGGKNPDMKYINRLFAETAEGGKPFCLFACSNEPHSPWNKGDASAYPPAKVKLPPYIVDTPRVRSDFSKYLAEITYYDSQVGEIVGLLKKHGLSDNTLVMVVSEQGSAFPFGKWTCYDHGLQSAMIVRWPGKVTAGKTSDALFATVDFMPTFASLAGFEVPNDRKIDGVDQTSLLLGTNKQGNRTNYYYQGNGVRQGKWKYLVANQKVYGYARDMDRPLVEELYNLDRDIGETNNLASRYPEKVEMLKALMNSIKEDATVQPVQKLR